MAIQFNFSVFIFLNFNLVILGSYFMMHEIGEPCKEGVHTFQTSFAKWRVGAIVFLNAVSNKLFLKIFVQDPNPHKKPIIGPLELRSVACTTRL